MFLFLGRCRCLCRCLCFCLRLRLCLCLRACACLCLPLTLSRGRCACASSRRATRTRSVSRSSSTSEPGRPVPAGRAGRNAGQARTSRPGRAEIPVRPAGPDPPSSLLVKQRPPGCRGPAARPKSAAETPTRLNCDSSLNFESARSTCRSAAVRRPCQSTVEERSSSFPLSGSSSLAGDPPTVAAVTSLVRSADRTHCHPTIGNEALHGACDGGGGCGAAGPAALAEPTEGLLSLDSESILTSDGLCQDPVLHESVTQNCKNCSGHEDSIMTYMSWKQRLQQAYSPHPMVFRFAILGL